MFTIGYRGWFIHGYCDRKACRIQLPDGVQIECASLDAAKRRIRNMQKETKDADA